MPAALQSAIHYLERVRKLPGSFSELTLSEMNIVTNVLAAYDVGQRSYMYSRLRLHILVSIYLGENVNINTRTTFAMVVRSVEKAGRNI